MKMEIAPKIAEGKEIEPLFGWSAATPPWPPDDGKEIDRYAKRTKLKAPEDDCHDVEMEIVDPQSESYQNA